ncbi:MAG: hypothetical protein KC589_03915 [Nanoarchaeota archaeon]|nr:hypothetical protein [Nanoarchaeota archaeon]
MASCMTISGIEGACGSFHGGIKAVSIIEYKAINSITDTVAGYVDAITYNNGYSGATYEFLQENSNWTQPPVGDGIVASIHWEPVVTLVFQKMTKELRNEEMELSKSRVVIFITDNNDTVWLVGSDKGLRLSAGPGEQSGTALDELNGET